MLRHIVNFFIGHSLEKTGLSLEQYLIDNGERNLNSFSHVICWSQESAFFLDAVENTENDFQSDLNGQFHIDKSEPLFSEYNDVNIKHFFSNDLPIINSVSSRSEENIDKTIGITLYVALYDEISTSEVLRLLSILHECEIDYDIDVIGLHPDLAFIFENEDKSTIANNNKTRLEKATKGAEDIVKLKSNFHHFIILQNFNEELISLNLDKDTFLKIIGEYSLLCIENYQNVFQDAGIAHDITGIGLSMMFLDKYYFTNYLLHSAFLNVLEKEHFNERVSVDDAVKTAQKKLIDNVHLLSDFYDNRKNQLVDENENFKVDIPQVVDAFREKIDHLKDDIQSILSDPSKTLPQKKAIFAQLLGQDDSSLTDCTFYTNLLTLDDCINESLNIFVQANNESVVSHKDGDKIIIDVPGTLPSNTDEGFVDLQLDEIRSTHEEMIDSITSIRKIDEQIKNYEELLHIGEQSHNRLTENGVQIGENKYKLLRNVEQDNFDSYYVPTIKDNFKNRIDLRPFTKVKDQGPAGTCSVFAIISIYEYILKKSESKDYDLSEHFVYYNITSPNKADLGTSFLDVINSIKKSGICEEELCKYDSNNIDVSPTENAYKNGLLHTIELAKGVKVQHEDILSAISEGYPVAIILKIFDSFMTSPGGAITFPSKEEINSDTNNYHAMVICGYDIKDKIYIARNSWGESWGDKGYCYIPFNYIENENLCRSACIITSINQGVETRGFINEPDNISFNDLDKRILYTILRNNRVEEVNKKEFLSGRYSELRRYYLDIRSRLEQNGVRKAIAEDKETLLNNKIAETQQTIGDFEHVIRPKLEKNFHNKKLKINLKLAGILAIFIVTWLVGFKLSDHWLSNKISWIFLGCVVVCSIIILIYNCIMRVEEKNNTKRYNETSKNNYLVKSRFVSDLSSIKLKMHLAGLFIDDFTKLDSSLMKTYLTLCSYVENLKLWYQEEKGKIEKLTPVAMNDSFIPLLSNKTLDGYFNDNKKDIASDIHCFQLFNKYDVDINSIEKFKINMKDILVKNLSNKLIDFTVYRYMTGIKHYKYLDDKNIGLDKISLLDKRSEVFLKPHTLNPKYYQYVFLYTDLKEKDSWNLEYKQKFNFEPNVFNASSPFRFTVLRVVYYQKDDILPFT